MPGFPHSSVGLGWGWAAEWAQQQDAPSCRWQRGGQTFPRVMGEFTPLHSSVGAHTAVVVLSPSHAHSDALAASSSLPPAGQAMELTCLVEAHQDPPEKPSALERVTELFSVSFDRWKSFSDFSLLPMHLRSFRISASEARDIFQWGTLALAFSLGTVSRSGPLLMASVRASPHCSYCNPPHPSLPHSVTSISPKWHL